MKSQDTCTQKITSANADEYERHQNQMTRSITKTHYHENRTMENDKMLYSQSVNTIIRNVFFSL